MPIDDGAKIHRPSPITDAKCIQCGQPLGTELFWVVRYPACVHERCMNFWGCPFYWGIRAIPALRRAPRFVDDPAPLLELAGKLDAMRARWPTDAHAVLREGRALIAEARDVVALLPAKLRADLA